MLLEKIDCVKSVKTVKIIKKCKVKLLKKETKTGKIVKNAIKINKKIKKKRIIWIEQLQLPLILFWIFLQDLLKRLKHLEERILLPCLKSLQK